LNIVLALTVTQDQICSLKCKLIILFSKEKDKRLFYKVKIVKLEELLDSMKTTKGNIPSPGEYVLSAKNKKYMMIIHFSTAFKWLKSAEIDFNPQGDLQQLQDISHFMATKCKYYTLDIIMLFCF
jgi:hypothetical protein